MEPTKGVGAAFGSAAGYELFMGRYSRPLAVVFADAAGVTPGQAALDVGCGSGALTTVLVDRLGAGFVAACDPSRPMVETCAVNHRGAAVVQARAEELPFGSDRFDAVLTELVLHFVADPEAAVGELRRVARPGGTIAACVWDFAEEMEMLRYFWDAALTVDAAAPDQARTLRFGAKGEIAELFTTAGLTDVVETTLRVSSTYEDFDELWSGYLAGIGPAGSFCLSLPERDRGALRAILFDRLGSPPGGFTLRATARCGLARVPA